MNKYLQTIVNIINNSNGSVSAKFKDVEAIKEFQRSSNEDGIVFGFKKIPLEYETQRGYIWQHNNSRDYQLTILKDERTI